MTPEEWDSHCWLIRQDMIKEGCGVPIASELAESETTVQFGERPGKAP